ncbi:hypothetical protein [Vulcanisaeta sp. JCM 14467]
MSLVFVKNRRKEVLIGSSSSPTLLISSSSTIHIPLLPLVIQGIMTLSGTMGELRGGAASSTITIPTLGKHLIKLELSRLMTYTRTLMADLETYKMLVKLAGDRKDILHIIWLIPMPFDTLNDEYKNLGLELFKLAIYRDDVFVVILDATKFHVTVMNIMNTFEISELPALIISEKPIDIERPNVRDTIVLKKGAIDRLIERGKVQDFLVNLPIWAAQGNLRSRARLEGVVKPLLGDLWDTIKDLIKFNI